MAAVANVSGAASSSDAAREPPKKAQRTDGSAVDSDAELKKEKGTLHVVAFNLGGESMTVDVPNDSIVSEVKSALASQYRFWDAELVLWQGEAVLSDTDALADLPQVDGTVELSFRMVTIAKQMAMRLWPHGVGRDANGFYRRPTPEREQGQEQEQEREYI